MAVLDLTLDSFELPGLENFTPEFGTKQPGGVSTLGLTKDIMLPFVKQRPVVAVESATTTEVQANCTIEATSYCAQIDLGAGAFVGVTVNVINSGNNTVVVRYENETVSKVFSGVNAEYAWAGTKWKVKASGGVSVSGATQKRRYLYPSVFDLPSRNRETDFIVKNDITHSKKSVYIRAGSTLPPFYAEGVGVLQYHTESDVTIEESSHDDTFTAFEPGKDYFVYLVYSPALFPDAPENLGFRISLNDPTGMSLYGNSDIAGIGVNPIKAHPEVDGVVLTDDNCFCIGGFHTVCSTKTSLDGVMIHPFTDYSAADVHPYSVWDCYHRPVSTTVGMSFVPTISKWCSIYLISERTFCKTGAWGNVYGGIYPQNNEILISAYGKAYCTGASGRKYHCLAGEQIARHQNMYFPNTAEFVSLSLGSPQGVNIAGSADPRTTGGHKATNGQDIVSYCGIEDTCGVLWQWGRNYGGGVAGTSWVNNYDANDKDVGGQSYQQSNRVLLGGGWNDGVYCGSRAAGWYYGVLYLSGYVGFRLLAESVNTN